jgi:hypothetical protein
MSTSLVKNYGLIGNGSVVKIKIDIGFGQLGVTKINLGDNTIVDNTQGSFEKVVGIDTELKGKKLFCVTTVTDVRNETNNTSVDYLLTGGIKAYSNSLQESVNSQGEVLFYTSMFIFV